MKLTEESILSLLRKKSSHPMKISELVKQLAIPDTQRREFRNKVKDMAQAGTLIRIRGGRYGLPDAMNLVTGIFKGHPNGYGFVTPDNKEDGEDLYIARTQTNTAMHLDKVIARVETRRGRDRPEGRVIRIVQRNTQSLVGVFEKFGANGWVIPMEEKYVHDVFVPAKKKGGAKPGQVVTVKIDAPPSNHQPPQGRVTEVLGFTDDPEVEIKSIFRKFGVHKEFPPRVLAEATRVEKTLAEGDADEQRKDLTKQLIFTIDGEKAKDFDDAVSLEMLKGVYRLGVHIADVSHFVREDSLLDKEAFQRGTSTYYPDGVIPMLPVQLSNEICSLKPGVKRLTVSVVIDFDANGTVLGSKSFLSTIQSKIRFTYKQVAALLKKGDPDKKFPDALPVLKHMHTLSQTLRKNRFQKGSVDMNIPEPEIEVDKNGKVTGIKLAEHNDAHELIEEFMLAANREIARFLTEKNVPVIHRIHEKPDEEKIADFNQFIASFGLRLRSTRNVRSVDLQNLLKRAKGHKEERTINLLLLRAMKKAIYSEKDPGHFALGFEHYTHFTSPIRRYPDLITHRLLKMFLKKRKCSQREKKRLLPKIAEQAEQSSATERKAMEIEREINDLRRAQFMLDKIGETYSGFIIGVTAFGFFVELTDVYVEGLVRVSSLTDDYYIFFETEHKLQGQRRHRTFTIGDPVTVRIHDVDIARRRIELTCVR